MSQRDLSRTVIEGGRHRQSHIHHRLVERSFRTAVRDAMNLMTHTDDDPPLPRRPFAGRWFHDRLGAARRWLASQAGRPWNAVHAELRARFDDRTLAGHHVLHDHLLAEVDRGQHTGFYPSRFVVDAHGLLRVNPAYRRHASVVASRRKAIQALLQRMRDLRVAQRGGALFWVTRVHGRKFRMGPRMTPAELGWWLEMPPWARQALRAGERWKED